MVYLDCPFVAKRNLPVIKNKKGILDRSGVDTDTFGKSFGFVLGN